MAHTTFSRNSLLALTLAATLALFASSPARADDDGSDSRALTPTGVYVKGEFTLPIIQQPGASAGFVSPADDTVTQFGLAAQYGTVGLLGHNYLAGGEFFGLEPGERVYLFHEARKIEVYVVTEVLQYQALSPFSPYSDFRDLSTGQTLSANDLFHKVYMGERHITFQTCIEKDGNSSWGRLFVIAEPLAAE
jgi:hypothetical protein